MHFTVAFLDEYPLTDSFELKAFMLILRHLHVEEELGDPFLPTLPWLHYMLRGVRGRRVPLAGNASLTVE